MQVIRFDTQVERGIFSSSAELARLIKEIKLSGFCGYSQCATFLEYYLRTVECPSNLKSIAKLLYQNPYGTFKFGFKDQQAVIDSFGLDNDRYEKQYQWALETKLLIRRNFAVEVAAETDTEIMYYANSAKLITHEEYAAC